jgi:hypothetical protein
MSLFFSSDMQGERDGATFASGSLVVERGEEDVYWVLGAWRTTHSTLGVLWDGIGGIRRWGRGCEFRGEMVGGGCVMVLAAEAVWSNAGGHLSCFKYCVLGVFSRLISPSLLHFEEKPKLGSPVPDQCRSRKSKLSGAHHRHNARPYLSSPDWTIRKLITCRRVTW